MRILMAMALCVPVTAWAQDQVLPSAPSRDPASVPLPAQTRVQLRLGSNAPLDAFGAAFDAMAPRGAIFIAGPGTTPAIVAAADRARVFLGYMQFDLDGDGVVSRVEYGDHSDVTWGTDIDADQRAILQQEWAAADLDADGKITLSEIQTLALRQIPTPTNAPLDAVQQAIMGMDLDNDSFIRWEEVEAVLQAYQ